MFQHLSDVIQSVSDMAWGELDIDTSDLLEYINGDFSKVLREAIDEGFYSYYEDDSNYLYYYDDKGLKIENNNQEDDWKNHLFLILAN
ncbi:hypothetical protein [Mycoplasmopsis agassizii]|uniref:Uncharacterized protein n=1 Tax=Mycoplasmopsis agassizii TaxID=33922 RepID=A0ABX4H4L3_9BACT|nr:hypothetical protein [Mycoplasmopsis agassizii]PAF54824.1 hypothetical protein CJF60_03760 [Mycoplasmopsis agassizii]SMC18661.1 hypothetical protein SAMN02745179_00744 [Mycoplasmopsis agassizii]